MRTPFSFMFLFKRRKKRSDGLGAGFTLLELIVVAGIVGLLTSVILSSLTGARRSARDALRITDMHQVQQALELFKFKCGFYPGRYSVSQPGLNGCVGGTGLTNDPDPNAGLDFVNPGDWGALNDFLKEAEIGISGIPYDPVPTYAARRFDYHVQLKPTNLLPLTNPLNTIPRAQCYVLEAHLETNHPILRTSADLDNSDIINKLLPLPPDPSCDPTVPASVGICKNLYKAVINCNDNPSGGYSHGYCVGNSECFHD